MILSNYEIIKAMKKRVYDANIDLPKQGLVKLTWGNVSEINRDLNIVVIKPSGVNYDIMSEGDMVLVDLEGNCLEANGKRPSSDLATHLYLYKSFANISAIVHTHSTEAVSWAQSDRALPTYGTTHADSFYGQVPLTRQLSENEVEQGYEHYTGEVIVQVFQDLQLDPIVTPGVLVRGHGPFTWGKTVSDAVENSVILEEICKMARYTEAINNEVSPLEKYISDKHYFRKHGKNAYYGQ